MGSKSVMWWFCSLDRIFVGHVPGVLSWLTHWHVYIVLLFVLYFSPLVCYVTHLSYCSRISLDSVEAVGVWLFGFFCVLKKPCVLHLCVQDIRNYVTDNKRQCSEKKNSHVLKWSFTFVCVVPCGMLTCRLVKAQQYMVEMVEWHTVHTDSVAE